MTSNLPEKAKPTTLGRGDLARFARLETQIEKAIKVAAEPIGAALRAIRDDKLYLATHPSFERYVVERWGFSKATAYRMMNDGKLAGISPPENASSQVSTSHSETNKGEPSTIGSPPPAEQSGGSGKAATSAVSKPGIDVPGSASPSGPSSGGARTTAPPVAPTDEALSSPGPAPLDPSERPPSRRQQASAIVAAFQDAEDGVGRGWTHEEATYLFARFRAERDAWATYNKASIQWADAPPAPAEKPQWRQGTITRPADRAPKPPVKVNGAPMGNLTRRDVTPMFKP